MLMVGFHCMSCVAVIDVDGIIVKIMEPLKCEILYKNLI